MTGRLLPLLALAFAAPALAQPAGSYEQAVAARIAGDPERAVALLERLLVADPANVDARLQLGLSLLALNRLDEAQRAFDTVLQAAPDYADARIGLALIAERRGDTQGALAEAARVGPGNAEAEALRRRLDQPLWQLDVDGSYSALQGPAQDWQGASMQLRRQVSQGTALSGRVELARRFGRADVYGEVRIDRLLSADATGYVAFGAGPGADFLPQWQVAGGGTVRVRGGDDPTVLTLDMRLAEYATGDVETFSPGVEQYFAQGRLWLTGRWINVIDQTDAHRSGYLVRLDGLATERLRLFAGYSNAPDTSEGVVIDTQAFFGGASLDIGDRTTLRASLAYEDRETGADRTELGLGLGVRF